MKPGSSAHLRKRSADASEVRRAGTTDRVKSKDCNDRIGNHVERVSQNWRDAVVPAESTDQSGSSVHHGHVCRMNERQSYFFLELLMKK